MLFWRLCSATIVENYNSDKRLWDKWGSGDSYGHTTGTGMGVLRV